jgi:CheY-like chemotaxis protein
MTLGTEAAWPSGGGWPWRVFTTRSQDSGGPGKQPAPPARILLVEDDYFVALSSEDALSDAGHDVVGVAANADDAVALAGAERPDLVVMDIRLSGLRDGIDAAKEIRDRFAIPSIFVTAQADPGTRQRGEREAHPLGWLMKPFAASELADAVADALALARRRKPRTPPKA